ncbi:pituitary tumor-transforming gene 1 protein-interacting protein isoform X2 [Balaenoptera ricei]|uniref:pituitary tumor-transforming gene 1 protein-interacting protein isoform X2 n=1 Tax=Balaenoptera ricei TaxID=2746895 RepID=UPI0028BDA40F|nr:pituitary tumor-transforming gene 1 protein-interacting protein isoform X2 [Balaenoptera ricei]
MASGRVRGPTPRLGLALGGAALFLLFLPEAAAQGCSQNTNRTCEECLKNVSCLWCNTDKACLDYPVTKILPPSSLCKLSSARWGVCWEESHARTRGDGGHLQAKERGLRRYPSCPHLDLGLPASRTVRDYLFKLPSLWYFVMAAELTKTSY